MELSGRPFEGAFVTSLHDPHIKSRSGWFRHHLMGQLFDHKIDHDRFYCRNKNGTRENGPKIRASGTDRHFAGESYVTTTTPYLDSNLGKIQKCLSKTNRLRCNCTVCLFYLFWFTVDRHNLLSNNFGLMLNVLICTISICFHVWWGFWRFDTVMVPLNNLWLLIKSI